MEEHNLYRQGRHPRATDRSLIIRMAKAFREVLLPDRCLVCNSFFFYRPQASIDTLAGDPAAHDFQGCMTPFLCPRCALDFQPVKPPFCTTCGIMFDTRSDENHPCGDCITSPKHYFRARALGAYAGSLREVIQGLKYKGYVRLAKPLGDLLLQTLQKHFYGDLMDLIVPVPLHIRRLRKRGFNQAHLLVAAWPRSGSPKDCKRGCLRLVSDGLKRRRDTQPQTGLGRHRRIDNIKNAFTISTPELFAGRKVLLVDDVFTTGATVNECARVIMESGAARVDVLTLARAL